MARTSANTAWDWIRRWGLWILLLLGVVLAALVWLLPTRRGKPKILEQAKDGADAIRERAHKELVSHEHKMAARRKELEAITAIEEEDARLKALADFANRER